MEFKQGDAVMIVDVQKDFCPGGALAIPEGDKVVPVCSDWLRAAERKNVPSFLSRDWHPADHVSFKQRGGEWPPHCIQDSDGAAFHEDLAVPSKAIVVTKGVRFDQDQYSVFDQTGLEAELKHHDVKRLWIGGLAQDVCVLASALSARRAGFAVSLIPNATRPVSKEKGAKAIEEMREAGVALGA